MIARLFANSTRAACCREKLFVRESCCVRQAVPYGLLATNSKGSLATPGLQGVPNR